MDKLKMTQDEIIRMAREAGWDVSDQEMLEKFAALVTEATKEKAAKVCEDHFSSDGHWCAAAIRSMK